MKKIRAIMPLWGPYSKKYSGISRITDHDTEKGVRFDLVVSPALANTNTCPPNVTIPVGVHPWTAKADYSYYSYRCDLEWKDVIYADVSFTKLTDESVLVCTTLVNNSDMTQNFLVNYFSALEFPGRFSAHLTLPKICAYKKATDYAAYSYHTPRPWDEQCMDAMKKGEFFDDRFVEHRGLGDRDDNRYILPKYPRFGEEAGDSVSYCMEIPESLQDPVLSVRYRTVDARDCKFLLNGEPVVFPATDGEMAIVQFRPQALRGKTFTLQFVSQGTGALELDFLAVTQACDANAIVVENIPHAYKPQIQTKAEADGARAEYRYDGVQKPFVLRTFNTQTRFRDFPTGALEDSPTSRITQPDESFHNMLEQFSGSFSEKHSDDGFYHNAVMHTIYAKPHTVKKEYAVISYGETDYHDIPYYEGVHIAAQASLEPAGFTKAGEPYAFSYELLRAALFQNVVYPLYCHGEYVPHHTPGKRWDSFYTWDSGFIGLAMANFAPEIADATLDLYFSDRDNPDYAFLLHGSPVPVHLYQYLEMLNAAEDKTKLYAYYDRAKLFYEFLAGRTHGSTTARFQSRLTTTFDYFYNCAGMDDLPPQKEMYRRGLQLKTAPAISTSQVIRTAKLLRIVALQTGRTEDAAVYEQDIRRLTDALQTYSWDEECGYFSYVLHDEAGKPVAQLRTEAGENLNKTLDGVYPLIAGAVTEEQKERLLAHLKSEAEMFTPVGISAVDRTASYYITNGYWNGNVWIAHQWFVWKTMLDLGETDFAWKIAKTALDAWKREVEYSHYTFEMFSIETGRGGWFHNFGGLSAPICLWAQAYFKPGTHQTGFDTFCTHGAFSEDCTAFSGSFTNYGDRSGTLLLCLRENGTYRVCVNGAQTNPVERLPGVLEICLPVGESDVTVQLV